MVEYAEKKVTLLSVREAAHFSIAEMAESLGLGKSTYQGYETGRRTPPDDLLETMIMQNKNNAELAAGLCDRVDEALIKGKTNGFRI